MNHYPFHIGDYIKDTAHLTPMEDIAYRRLLDLYYDTEKPIPLETQWVCRKIRLETDLIVSVLEEFFERTDDGWHHARCDDEIARYQAQCERNKINGKAGGRPKKTQSVASGFVVNNPLESQPEPEPEPEPEPIKPTEANASVVASKPATPECPHQEIIAMYHEILPMCPSVREWTNGRSSNLKTRWREKAKRQDLAWWRRFFEFVSESEFLTGRGVATPGRDPFVADLGWLVKPENFAKVVEGKYHSQREAA